MGCNKPVASDTFVDLDESEGEAASNNGFQTNSRKKTTGKASTSSQSITIKKKVGKDKTVFGSHKHSGLYVIIVDSHRLLPTSTSGYSVKQ